MRSHGPHGPVVGTTFLIKKMVGTAAQPYLFVWALPSIAYSPVLCFFSSFELRKGIAILFLFSYKNLA